MTLTENQAQWLATGERGMSSEALFERLTGHRVTTALARAMHPRDPNDLRRCLLMLEQCGLASRVHEAADLSAAWARLLGAWPHLVSSLEREVGDWRDARVGAWAPDTYKMMEDLLDG